MQRAITEHYKLIQLIQLILFWLVQKLSSTITDVLTGQHSACTGYSISVYEMTVPCCTSQREGWHYPTGTLLYICKSHQGRNPYFNSNCKVLIFNYIILISEWHLHIFCVKYVLYVWILRTVFKDVCFTGAQLSYSS